VKAGRLHGWATVATVAFLAVNLAFAFSRVLHDRMDYDEPQHLHLAWLTAGGAVVYRDFWDNHGPLYTLLNGAAIALLRPEPGPGLVVGFRVAAFATLLAMLAATMALARALGLGRGGALLAGALASALFLVQDHATELRPDPLQTLFWLAGLLLFARGTGRRATATLAAAGALFGLAVLTNAKAALGPAAVGVHLLLSPWLLGARRGDVARELAALAAGAATVVAIAGAWFLANGALDDLWQHAVAANFAVLGADDAEPRGWRWARFFLSDQLPFVLAVAAGAIAWLAQARDTTEPRARAAAVLLLVTATLTTAGMAINLFPWFYLLFLPLLAIVAARGVVAVAARVAADGGRGVALLALALALGAASLLRESSIRTPFTDHPDWRVQQRVLRDVVATVPRTEPVAALWDGCPAYVFQANVQYWWIADGLMGRVAVALTGTDPFGPAFVARLEQGPVRLVSGTADGALAELPAATRAFITGRYAHDGACLWRLRDDR